MNIFARELVRILGSHGKELGSLFSLRVRDSYTGVARQIVPGKITRLKRSLTENITATLNAGELDALQAFVPLDREGKELRRLHAALVAEAVRSLLSGRIEVKQANDLGDIVLALMTEEDGAKLAALRDALLKPTGGVRGLDMQDPLILRGSRDSGEPVSGSAEERIEQALDDGAEAYSQGALWLEVARGARDETARLGYAAQAANLFRQARDLIRDAPTAAQGTPQQRDWLAASESALAEAERLR